MFLNDIVSIVTGHIIRAAGQDCLVTPDGQVTHFNKDYINVKDLGDLKRGIYEKAELEILKSFFQPSDSIVEIGSNIGVVARTAFQQVLKPDGVIHCIEANPYSIKALERNLRSAKISDDTKQFHIHEAAIVSPNLDGTEVSFTIRKDLSSGLSSCLRRRISDDKISVKGLALASF